MSTKKLFYNKKRYFPSIMSTGGSSVLSLWQSSYYLLLNNPQAVSAAQSGKCATNVDAICISQVSPCQATAMAGSCSTPGCPPKATLFASTNVPYQVDGIGVLPLSEFRNLPGIV